MKPQLSIRTERLPEIEDAERKKFAESVIRSLLRYDRDYELVGDCIAQRCAAANQSYINMFFVIADCLYDYYELSDRHFELLELAVGHLERLYRAQIESLPAAAAEEKTKVQMELSDYIDKVALIFQTAADRTGDESSRRDYERAAHEYSAKADGWRGALETNYLEKIHRLCKNAAGKYRVVGELFRRRAEEYREKYEAEGSPTHTAFSSRFFARSGAGSSDDREPLLGLHRRRPWHTAVAAASLPHDGR